MQTNRSENSSSIKTAKAIRCRNYQERSVPKFLKKVFFILEENKHCELISWSNDGLAIVIKRPTEFAEQVLPLYFKHNNFASFIRQLNMYKFKKRKCYQYDHIYYHEMFQRGKIDLLRNIQRKCHDMMQFAPMNLKETSDEVQVDVDLLLQENIQYKKIHKTLTTQIQFIEDKMKELKCEVTNLYNEKMQTQANESFLKKIIKALTKTYGYENIARVIELDVEDTNQSATIQGSQKQAVCQETSGTSGDDDRSLFQQSNTSIDECYLENYLQESPEYELSEELQPNSVVKPYNGCQLIYNNNSNKSIARQDNKNINMANSHLSASDYEQAALDAIRVSNPKAYKTIMKEYETRSSELPLFSHSNNFNGREIQIDQPYNEKNQLFCGTDF